MNKAFRDWKFEEVQRTFGLIRSFQHPLLEELLHKKEVEATGDPLGQLLIAMVGAQRQNEGAIPLYGCYVLGRNWFFVLLENSNQYAVSNAFNATEEDIFSIYSILEQIRQRLALVAGD